MSGSSNQYVYGLGTTLISVPAGNTSMPVIPPAHTNSLTFRYLSGGSLSVTNQLAQAGSLGYLLGASDYNIDGPAQFFLNATGATAVCAVMFKYSAGYSLTP